MGNLPSNGPTSNGVELRTEDVQRYMRQTSFKDREIITLADKYRTLAGSRDLGGDGVIREKQFIDQLKFPNVHIGARIYALMDTDGDGTMSFDEFIMGLNAFLPTAPIDQRIDQCFRAYDVDGDGTISKDEVREIVESSLGDGDSLIRMSPTRVTMLLDELFVKFDPNCNGVLSKAEFTSLIRQAPGILDCFTFNVSVLVT